ncbi:hypothetical protein ABR759_09600 [Escherichia coli]
MDIGGMSLVAMNNVPPAPANYLQRAGRAGRRGESASAAITLCKKTRRMEWRYSKTPSGRSTLLPVRHGFVLGAAVLFNDMLMPLVFRSVFLRAEVPDATKLSCKWFFEGDESQCLRFLHWLNNRGRSAGG